LKQEFQYFIKLRLFDDRMNSSCCRSITTVNNIDIQGAI